jgi:vacuolar-type H+-ATPase subunit I/STV1
MDIIELLAVIILVAAIVFLVYYYIKTANDGNIDIKEILKFSPKDNNVSNLVDEDIQEKKSMGDKIKYTFKDIDKSYANTTDAFSRRLDSFLDERSEELIESWSLVTTDDLSSLEERYTTACDSIEALEKRFNEFTNATDAKIEDLDKRLKALEDAEKDLEEAEEVAVEAEKE